MAHKQRTPFTLKSGNKTSFKAMGSSPMRLSRTPTATPAGQFVEQDGGNPRSGKLPQGQAMATPAGKPQKPQLSPEMMKAGEEMRSKMIANGRREHAEMMEAHKKGAGSSGSAEAQALRAQARAQQGLNTTGGSSQAQIDLFNQASKAVPQGPNTMGGYKGLNRQGPNTIMNAQAPALTPEQKFALSSTSVRMPVGASRPQEQGNPVQAPQAANMKQGARGDYENFERKLKGEESSSRSRYGQVRGLVNTNAQAPAQPNTPRVAVQSAPRPDLSGGPRQPMGGLGQPMGGSGFGGPGQLPPNKGRRRPGM
jgi:hypothetical protein